MLRIPTICHVSVLVLLTSGPALADAPTPKQALGLTPIQPHVNYAQPSDEEIQRCTIKAEKAGNETAWVVRNASGEVLRRFSDTNGDNVVDRWSYFNMGLEVYRDIDANFNGKADQYRWFHTGGTRWGLDDNEDGKIDRWKVISAQEVAEEVVIALKSRDRQRFELLLANQKDLEKLGLGDGLGKQVGKSIDEAPRQFQQMLSSQDLVSSDTEFLDFGGARPATVPAGANGLEQDITVYENASALVQSGNKHGQIHLGTLVALDGGWRLLGAPTMEASATSANPFFVASSGSAPLAAGATGEAPTQEMEKLIDQLQKLDAQAESAPPGRRGSLADQRAEVLGKLAEVTPGAEMRDQWIRQLADMLATEVQMGGYEQGVKRLARLEDQLAKGRANPDLLAHIKFRRMWADYGLAQQAKDPDFAKIQEKWLSDLEGFVKAYPKSSDTVEALLQLGMTNEFQGKIEQAQEWYQKLAEEFPNDPVAAKASGALQRLGAEGKSISLRGNALRGGSVDLASLRGKVVIVHYWATWCERCITDMAVIKELLAKYGNRGLVVVGVCLDNSAEGAKKLAAEKKLPWANLHEEGGLDGRLGNEMGVMNLPLMMLVDQRGTVANRDIQTAQLEEEIRSLLKL